MDLYNWGLRFAMALWEGFRVVGMVGVVAHCVFSMGWR